jgi:hypothetical protein
MSKERLPGVPTLPSIDYALVALKAALHSIEVRQKMNRADQLAEVQKANYANATTLQGIGIGLTMAETLVRVEIETLEGRRNAVEVYEASLA